MDALNGAVATIQSECFIIVKRHPYSRESNSGARTDAWGLNHNSGILSAGLIVPSQDYLVDLENKQRGS